MGNGADLSTNRSSPVVDLTSADFDSLKSDMQSYAQANYADRWTDFNPSNPGVMQLEITAYLGDLLTYQLNSHIRELFAATVLRRQNLLNIGKPFGYEPQGAVSSSVTERFTLDPAGAYPMTISKTHQLSNEADGDAQVIFQPVADTAVPAYPAGGTVDVVCIEGELFQNVLIGVSGNSPGQRWQFPQQSVVKNSVSVTVGGVTWTAVTNWTTALSTSQFYKIVQTDDGNTYAVFGDGVFGAVPANGATIVSTFRVGGGRRGNVSQLTVTRKVNVDPAVLTVTNPAQAGGGDNAQSLKQAREGIPGTLSTITRAVTDKDYAVLAQLVAGVAKARATTGTPAGSNKVRLIIAPSGGGDPSPVLKNAVSTYLFTKKMTGKRVSIQGPAYKNIRALVLLYVNQNYRAAEVNAAARAGLINTLGTGVLDFAQLDFAGQVQTADGNKELLFGQTRLQAYFDGLKKNGLDRAEILQLDVEPIARPRDSGNTGTGSIGVVTLNGRQRRREYSIQIISSAQYVVYERIVGLVASMSDAILTDDTKDFAFEGISSYSGYRLIPNRDASSDAAVISAVGQQVTVGGLGGVSLFTLTEVGREYVLYNPVAATINIGSPFTSSDGNVSFTLSAGATAFIAGDSFLLDVFPSISDIRLRADEYPQLSDPNFITRTSGGSRV